MVNRKLKITNYDLSGCPKPSPLGRVAFQNAAHFEKTGEEQDSLIISPYVPVAAAPLPTSLCSATFPKGEGFWRATSGRPYNFCGICRGRPPDVPFGKLVCRLAADGSSGTPTPTKRMDKS